MNLDKIVKKYNFNMLIGIDNIMEYRFKDVIEWILIIIIKLILSFGEYLVRVVLNNNELVLEVFKVVIS